MLLPTACQRQSENARAAIFFFAVRPVLTCNWGEKGRWRHPLTREREGGGARDGDDSAEERARAGSVAFEQVSKRDHDDRRGGDDGQHDAARVVLQRPLITSDAEGWTGEAVEQHPEPDGRTPMRLVPLCWPLGIPNTQTVFPQD